MAVIRLDVTHAGGSYPVLIGAALTRQVGPMLAEQRLVSTTAVVSCPPVWRQHSARMQDVLGGHPPLLIPDGEKAKQLATVARLYDGLLERRIDRSAIVIGFGGGVVGDAAGFAIAAAGICACGVWAF